MVVVRRAHVDPLLRPGDLQCAPRLEPHGPSRPHALCSRPALCLRRLRHAVRLPHMRQLRLQREPHPLKHRTSFAILAHADAVLVLAQYDRTKNLRPKRNIRTAMNNGARPRWRRRPRPADHRRDGTDSEPRDERPLFPFLPARTRAIPNAALGSHLPLCCVRNHAVRHRAEGAARLRQSGGGVQVQCAPSPRRTHCAHPRVHPLTLAVPVCLAGMSRYGVTPNVASID